MTFVTLYQGVPIEFRHQRHLDLDFDMLPIIGPRKVFRHKHIVIGNLISHSSLELLNKFWKERLKVAQQLIFKHSGEN